MGADLVTFVLGHYGVIAILATISYAVGRRLTLGLPYRSGWEQFAFCTGLGLGAIAYLLMLLGFVQRLTLPWVLAALAACILACWPVWEELAGQVRAWRRWKSKGIHLLAAVAMAPLLAFAVLPLYPPTTWDSTMYHLALAKLYAQSNAIPFTPHIRFSLFPQANQMLFTLMLLVSDDVSAQLVQFLMAGLVAAMLFAWGQRRCSTWVGLWAAALWWGSPQVVWLAASAYIDIGLTLFVLLALVALDRWWEDGDRRWVLLAGAFAGLAAASKYLGLIIAVGAGLGVLSRSLRRREGLAAALGFVLGVLVVAGPWYARSLHYSGNPVHPYLAGVFGTGHLSAEDVRGMLQEQTGHGVERTVMNLLLLPWHLTVHPERFFPEASMNPFYVIGLLAVTIRSARSRPVRTLATVVMGYGLVWFFTYQVARYLLPILPVFCLAAASSLEPGLRWVRGSRFFRQAVAGSVALLFLLPGWADATHRIRQYGPIPVTAEEQRRFLEQRHIPYGAIHFLNSRKGRAYTVYVLYAENVAYFVDGQFLGDWIGPAGYSRITTAMTSGPALYQALTALGADHFLYTTNRFRVPLPDDEAFYRKFRLVYARPYVQVYEIGGPAVAYRRIVSDELLRNPRFEAVRGDVPEAWEAVGRPGVEVLGGGRGVVARGEAEAFFLQGVPTRPQRFYALSVLARAASRHGHARLHINWRDERGHLIRVDIRDVEVRREWQRYSMVTEAPEGAVTAWVVLDVYGSEAVRYDDVSLREITYVILPPGN